MTQSAILAVGQTAATSSDVTLTAGTHGQVGLYCADLATPVNATHSTASTGGTLAPATYYYRVSALNALGETLASTETSQVVGAGTSTNTVTVKWTKVTGATGYKVYGRTTGAELFIATVGDVAQYIDTGAVTPAGALPAANTTSAGFDPSTECDVFQTTPGKPVRVGVLNPKSPVMHLIGPGTWNVRRPVIQGGLNVGIFKDI